MKRTMFTDDQIIGILKEHEAGIPIAALCRQHGVSNASIYKWKAKFCGLDVSDAERAWAELGKRIVLPSFEEALGGKVPRRSACPYR